MINKTKINKKIIVLLIKQLIKINNNNNNKKYKKSNKFKRNSFNFVDHYKEKHINIVYRPIYKISFNKIVIQMIIIIFSINNQIKRQ